MKFQSILKYYFFYFFFFSKNIFIIFFFFFRKTFFFFFFFQFLFILSFMSGITKAIQILWKDPPFGRVFDVPKSAETIARAYKPLLERKHSLVKPSATYSIENWSNPKSDAVVGRWMAPTENPFRMPYGSYSWGVWWPGQHLGAYRFHGSSGNLVCYRFDICSEVKRTETAESTALEYSDLFVDIWIWPSHEGKIISPSIASSFSPDVITIEDWDEFESAMSNNRLSQLDVQIVHETVRQLTLHPQEIISRVDHAIDTAILDQHST